jgi:hypothetical protein
LNRDLIPGYYTDISVSDKAKYDYHLIKTDWALEPAVEPAVEPARLDKLGYTDVSEMIDDH